MTFYAFYWDSFDKSNDLDDLDVVKSIQDQHGEDLVHLFERDNEAVLETYFHGRPEDIEYTKGLQQKIEQDYGCSHWDWATAQNNSSISFPSLNDPHFQNPTLLTLSQLNEKLKELGLEVFVPFYRGE